MRSVISSFILLVSPSSEEHMSACVACGQTARAFLGAWQSQLVQCCQACCLRVIDAASTRWLHGWLKPRLNCHWPCGMKAMGAWTQRHEWTHPACQGLSLAFRILIQSAHNFGIGYWCSCSEEMCKALLRSGPDNRHTSHGHKPPHHPRLSPLNNLQASTSGWNCWN